MTTKYSNFLSNAKMYAIDKSEDIVSMEFQSLNIFSLYVEHATYRDSQKKPYYTTYRCEEKTNDEINTPILPILVYDQFIQM